MNSDHVMSARTIAIDKMEFYIQESIYYRSYSEHMNQDLKIVLWNIKDEIGKAKIE